jgi:RNA polymerase-binding transcription factor DksA
VLSLEASDLSKARHGGGPILEELCDAKQLAPCVGIFDCDVLPLRQKRELLAVRANRALGVEEAALFQGTADARARELAELRRDLVEERGEIVDENQRLTAEWTGGLDATGLAGPGEERELSRSGLSLHMDERVQSLRLARLDAIDRALEALRLGRYGDCARCGGSIDAARLRDAPDTRVCGKCAGEAVSESQALGREVTLGTPR